MERLKLFLRGISGTLIGDNIVSRFNRYLVSNNINVDTSFSDDSIFHLFSSFELDSILSDIKEISSNLGLILDGKHHFYNVISCFMVSDDENCRIASLIIENDELFEKYEIQYNVDDYKILKIDLIN